MKRTISFLSILVASLLAATLLAGCSGQQDDSTQSQSEPASASAGPASGDSSQDASSQGDASGDASGDVTGATFDYSGGIDERGYWENIVAMDCVTLFDYKAITIPSDVHTVTDESLQTQIDNLMSNFSSDAQITDRAVADGDTVNIDFVGSVDGVEFDGGNTGGSGTEVTIGVTNYIDDFLQQLIGHMPGETFNVEVTFPEDYGADHLNGKDAVFVTTVNHIVETNLPELTDDFVTDNFYSSYGWSTVEGMTGEMQADMKRAAIQSYLQEYIISEGEVLTMPESLMTYVEASLIQYYQESASMYGMAFDEFLTNSEGVSSAEELLEAYRTENQKMASFYLLVQAIAEDAKILVNEEDVADYFEFQTGDSDYSMYEEHYGMPYLKQMTLYQKVMDHLTEIAILA